MDIKYFENKLALVKKIINKKDYEITHYYKDGEKIATVAGDSEFLFGVYAHPEKTIEDVRNDHGSKEIIFNETDYNAEKLEQNRLNRELYDEFREVLFSDLHLAEHPRKMKLWNYITTEYDWTDFQTVYHHVEQIADCMN